MRPAKGDLTTPVSEESAPFGRFQGSNFYISIFDIGRMAVGEQKDTDGNGSFSDGSKTYWFWFTTRNGHLGTGVRVTRTSDTQWVVEASPDVGSTGTVVELTDGLSTVLGYYNLTFHLTINKL